MTRKMPAVARQEAAGSRSVGSATHIFSNQAVPPVSHCECKKDAGSFATDRMTTKDPMVMNACGMVNLKAVKGLTPAFAMTSRDSSCICCAASPHPSPLPPAYMYFLRISSNLGCIRVDIALRRVCWICSGKEITLSANAYAKMPPHQGKPDKVCISSMLPWKNQNRGSIRLFQYTGSINFVNPSFTPSKPLPGSKFTGGTTALDTNESFAASTTDSGAFDVEYVRNPFAPLTNAFTTT